MSTYQIGPFCALLTKLKPPKTAQKLALIYYFQDTHDQP